MIGDAPMRVMVMGRSGQLARELAGALAGPHREVSFHGRPEFDLAHPELAARAITARVPHVVINAAAYTAVEKAEDERAAAFALNAYGPGAAARAAAEIGAAFIQISTDYVFDGTKGSAYNERDVPCPASVYGESKLAGEESVLRAHPGAIVLRTAWLVSPFGTNFLKTMLRLAGERDHVQVVDDQFGRPSFARDVAGAISHILDQPLGHSGPGQAGLFHLVNTGETTWFGFASAIMAGSAARGGPHCEVRAVTSAQFPSRVRRPPDSRLDTAKIASAFGVRLPDWRASLDACLDTLLGSVKNASL